MNKDLIKWVETHTHTQILDKVMKTIQDVEAEFNKKIETLNKISAEI